MLRICSLFVLILAGTAHADVRGAARVIDGDTLDVAGTTVRIEGIDAPELDQRCEGPGEDWACGAWSRDRMVALIAGREVICAGDVQDRYDRLVARCRAGQGDLGAEMVRDGAALAYRRYSHAYIRDERAAHSAGRGVWQHGGRYVTRPADYRATRRTGGQADGAPETPPRVDCAIKGNISSSGQIYHLPGQRDYARTRIDTTRGERWFCTEEQARAAGCRPARR